LTYSLTNQALINSFGSKTFYKGVTYSKEGKVRHIDAQEYPDLMIKLHASVLGKGSVYETNALFSYTNGNIRSSCSCPVGTNCKHSVALLYEYINKKDEKPNALLNWLHDIKENKSVLDEKSKQEFLIYRMYYDSAEKNFYVNFRIAKYQKNSKFSKGRSIEHYKIANDYYSTAKVLDESDKKIISLLSVSLIDSYGSDSWLDGELGYMAMKKLTQTDRLFHLDSHIPIKFSNTPIDIEPKWVNKDGKSTLELLPHGQSFIFTEPLCVINPRRHIISEVKSLNLTNKELKNTLNMPAIDDSEIIKTAPMLLDVPMFANLPLPPQLEASLVKDVEPKCFLQLEGFHDGDVYYPYMKIKFKYLDQIVDGLDSKKIETIKSENSLVRVYRNLQIEKEEILKIVDLGFNILQDKKHFSSSTNPNIATAIERWRNFLDIEIENLRSCGWQIEIDESFKLEFHEIDNIDATFDEQSNWFDMQLDVEIDGKKTALLPMLAGILDQVDDLKQLPPTLSLPVNDDGVYATIEAKIVAPIIKVILELFDKKSGSLNLKAYDANSLNLLEDTLGEKLRISGGQKLLEIAKKLKSFKKIEKVSTPNGLQTTLRKYQHDGLNWLNFLREFNFGGILADDMGLGKTVQTLAFLLYEKEQNRLHSPVLVIAPTSLMGNWRREATKFAPSLKVVTYHGLERHKKEEALKRSDIVITTYALAQRDRELLGAYKWYYIILDEAQAIKNSKSKIATALKHYKADNRLCLTGTPMENHLGELWSIYDFLMPGFLSSEKSFKEHYRDPIEKDGDNKIKNVLTKRISPFMLRRKKSEVVKELPAKTEMIRSTTFGDEQAKLYETIRVTMEKRVRDMIAQKGMGQSHITMLDALLKLRQVCCDPRLLNMDEAKKIGQSAKLDMAMELIDELLEENRRILLFSQFTSMLKLIEERLNEKSLKYTKLTGQTRKRDEVIEKFQNGDVDIFLISLKAGGVGLNLTQADTVIHYDPWWNPAVENQATDRAHRIGQDRRVFVYKLIIEGSVEEKILELQGKKQALQDAVLSDKSGVTGLNGDDIAKLLE